MSGDQINAAVMQHLSQSRTPPPLPSNFGQPSQVPPARLPQVGPSPAESLIAQSYVEHPVKRIDSGNVHIAYRPSAPGGEAAMEQAAAPNGVRAMASLLGTQAYLRGSGPFQSENPEIQTAYGEATLGHKTAAAADLLGGGFEAIQPLVMAGAALTPLKTMPILLRAAVAGKAGEYVAKKFGLEPDAVRLTEEVSALAGAGWGGYKTVSDLYRVKLTDTISKNMMAQQPGLSAIEAAQYAAERVDLFKKTGNPMYIDYPGVHEQGLGKLAKDVTQEAVQIAKTAIPGAGSSVEGKEAPTERVPTASESLDAANHGADYFRNKMGGETKARLLSGDSQPENHIPSGLPDHLREPFLAGMRSEINAQAKTQARATGETATAAESAAASPAQEVAQPRPTGIDAWRLKSLDVIDKHIHQTLSGEVIARTFKNKGIDREELESLGLTGFLKSTDRYTPEQLKDFINSQQFGVKEIVKKAAEATPEMTEYAQLSVERNDIYNQLGHYGTETPTEESVAARAALTERLNAITNRAHELSPYLSKTDETRFETYSLPGGENYREVLWQKPTEAPGISTLGGEGGPESLPATKGAFYGNHWDEPNVLFHMRFKDRVDPDGKKVLFLEELQSDWHQQGREIGYRNAADTQRLQQARELRAERNDIQTQMQQFYSTDPRYHELVAKDVELGRKIHALGFGQDMSGGITDRQVPDAPFKKNWHEVGLRRALQTAIEGGYDKLAWTTGDQQVERYPGVDAEQAAGLRQWYDERIPGYLNKLGAKFGGAKVEDTHVEIGPRVSTGEAVEGVSHTGAHSIDITPEMRASRSISEPHFWGHPEPDKLAPPKTREEFSQRALEGTHLEANKAAQEAAAALFDHQQAQAQAEWNYSHPMEPMPHGPGAMDIQEPSPTKTPLLDLTKSILSQSTPPKASLWQRLTSGEKLSENLAALKGWDPKDAFLNSMAKLQGHFSAMANNFKSPPKFGDYERATGQWSGADQFSSWEIKQFVDAIKEKVPDKARREAITNWIEADGSAETLRTRANGSSDKYAQGYKDALTLSDSELTIAQNIMNHHDALLKQAQGMGILTNGVENYIRHVYEDNPKAARALLAEQNFLSLNKTPTFARKRVFPTYYEAEQAGFTPKNKDVGFLTASYQRSMSEAMAARNYIGALRDGKATDSRPLAITSLASVRELTAPEAKSAEASGYLIRPNAGKPMTPEGFEHFKALRKLQSQMEAEGQDTTEVRKTITQLRNSQDFNTQDYRYINHPALRGWRWTQEDAEGRSMIVQGDMLVHPEIYNKLNNNLSKSSIRSATVNILGKEFQPGKALLTASSEVKHAILSFSGFHQTTLGLHALEARVAPAFMPKLDLTDPIQRGAIDHGLMVAGHDAVQQFGEGVASGGLMSKIPGVGPAYHTYVNYLFGDYLPRLKMEAYRRVLERNTDRYKDNLSQDQIQSLTASQVNAKFGGLNYRMLGRSQTMQDVLRLSLMAPDFTEARWRYLGQAIKPYGREQLQSALGGALVVYTTARILNMAHSGNPHWDQPFGIVDDKTSKVYGVRMFQQDMADAAQDIGNAFRLYPYFPYTSARLSPLASLAAKSLAGAAKDVYGRKISGSEAVHQAAGSLVPIPAQPWVQRSNDSNAIKALHTFGKILGVRMTKYVPTTAAPRDF